MAGAKTYCDGAMNHLFLKITILGFPFGFSLVWFTYWIVKIYKGKQKALQRKKNALTDQTAHSTES
jgi:hypothetical protein